MEWYWIGIVIGAVVAPWVVMGGQILTGFQERGIQTGLGLWFGTALVTTPMLLLVMWVLRLFIA